MCPPRFRSKVVFSSGGRETCNLDTGRTESTAAARRNRVVYCMKPTVVVGGVPTLSSDVRENVVYTGKRLEGRESNKTRVSDVRSARSVVCLRFNGTETPQLLPRQLTPSSPRVPLITNLANPEGWISPFLFIRRIFSPYTTTYTYNTYACTHERSSPLTAIPYRSMPVNCFGEILRS